MLLEQERKDVVKYCQRMSVSGLTTGTGGNISIFNRESGLFAISPSGVFYDEMTPEDVVVMDLDLKVAAGILKPSSEYALHGIFYQKRNDINAVVHTHSTFATVLATLREPLPASSYLIAVAGKDVPCAEYASFGTPELAQKTFEAMIDRKATLMANHGMIAGGNDIMNAFNIAEQIEECCKVYILARSAGEPKLLSDAEMETMVDRFANGYGQKKSKAWILNLGY